MFQYVLTGGSVSSQLPSASLFRKRGPASAPPPTAMPTETSSSSPSSSALPSAGQQRRHRHHSHTHARSASATTTSASATSALTTPASTSGSHLNNNNNTAAASASAASRAVPTMLKPSPTTPTTTTTTTAAGDFDFSSLRRRTSSLMGTMGAGRAAATAAANTAAGYLASATAMEYYASSPALASAATPASSSATGSGSAAVGSAAVPAKTKTKTKTGSLRSRSRANPSPGTGRIVEHLEEEEGGTVFVGGPNGSGSSASAFVSTSASSSPHSSPSSSSSSMAPGSSSSSDSGSVRRRRLSTGRTSITDGTGAAAAAADDDNDGFEDVPVLGYAVASNKRNADFHVLFPNVPGDDYLIEDYACAMQREIMVQGRMYISEAYLCFRANFFGWITDVSIPINSITSIEKRTTAFFIPNAILINTTTSTYAPSSSSSNSTGTVGVAAETTKSYTFSSFLSRDTTFEHLYNVWNFVSPERVAAFEREGKRALNDSAVAAAIASDLVTSPDRSLVAAAVTNAGADAAGGEGATTGTGAGKKRKIPRKPKTSACACSKERGHYSETALDVVLPGTPERVFDLMFRSTFLEGWMKGEQKLTELVKSEWTPSSSNPSLQTQTLSYIKPLNGPIGPKSTKCEIQHEQLHFDRDAPDGGDAAEPGWITMVSTTRTPNVPSGGVFCVKTKTCLSWCSHASTRVWVTSELEWSGSSWLKGVITSSALDGQKVYHADLEKAMRAYIQDHLSEFVPAPSPDDDEDGESASGELGEDSAPVVAVQRKAPGLTTTTTATPNVAKASSQTRVPSSSALVNFIKSSPDMLFATSKATLSFTLSASKAALALSVKGGRGVWRGLVGADGTGNGQVMALVVLVLVLSNVYTLVRLGEVQREVRDVVSRWAPPTPVVGAAAHQGGEGHYAMVAKTRHAVRANANSNGLRAPTGVGARAGAGAGAGFRHGKRQNQAAAGMQPGMLKAPSGEDEIKWSTMWKVKVPEVPDVSET